MRRLFYPSLRTIIGKYPYEIVKVNVWVIEISDF